jgi:hypothetical protein
MKNIMFIMVMALISHTDAIAQKIGAYKVPAPASDAFKTKFPAATNVSWEIEKKGVYEANFTNGKYKQAAQFDKDGKWQVTEINMKTSQLPKTVSDACAKAYPGYKMTEVVKMETLAFKECYELDISKGTEKLEVQILPNGEIIKRQKNSEKD